ncbi:MAG: hypothetical protein K2Q01_02535, partial [Rickettsiales bacterium]|nr:hypothetical protein [Rickettsiales bacterium]
MSPVTEKAVAYVLQAHAEHQGTMNLFQVIQNAAENNQLDTSQGSKNPVVNEYLIAAKGFQDAKQQYERSKGSPEAENFKAAMQEQQARMNEVQAKASNEYQTKVGYYTKDMQAHLHNQKISSLSNALGAFRAVESLPKMLADPNLSTGQKIAAGTMAAIGTGSGLAGAYLDIKYRADPSNLKSAKLGLVTSVATMPWQAYNLAENVGKLRTAITKDDAKASEITMASLSLTQSTLGLAGSSLTTYGTAANIASKFAKGARAARLVTRGAGASGVGLVVTAVGEVVGVGIEIGTYALERADVMVYVNNVKEDLRTTNQTSGKTEKYGDFAGAPPRDRGDEYVKLGQLIQKKTLRMPDGTEVNLGDTRDTAKLRENLVKLRDANRAEGQKRLDDGLLDIELSSGVIPSGGAYLAESAGLRTRRQNGNASVDAGTKMLTLSYDIDGALANLDDYERRMGEFKKQFGELEVEAKDQIRLLGLARDTVTIM